MYDMAKRSLAFTVATGGLLLTGTGYAPAEAAVGFGTLPGPAQAPGASAQQASPSSVSTPISVRGLVKDAPKAAVHDKVHVLIPQAPHVPNDPPSGAGATATSTVADSPGLLSGNTVQIPIDLGLNLCTNQANAGAAGNHVAPSACGGSGAAGGAHSGSSATASTSHSGGILSGNTIQAPVNVPLNVCGNQAIGGGLRNTVRGTTCPAGTGAGSEGSGGGASATAVTDHSGGVLSGNVIQMPVNVPVNACGNQADAIAARDTVTGSTCSANPAGGGHGGSNATAVVLNSGGIGSGMIVQTPINVPVNACGNQATGIGLDNKTGGSTCVNQTGSTSATSVTAYSGGIASGTSAQVPINVPVNACGNQADAIAARDTVGGGECVVPGGPSSTTTSVITNSGGILSGNQPAVPIDVPVNVCGNQADVVGILNQAGAGACNTGNNTPPGGTPSGSPSSSPSQTPPSGSPSGSPSSSPSGSPSTTPPGCGACGPSPSNSPTSTTPPGSPSTPPNTPPNTPHGGSLAGTGTEEGAVLAVAGAALLAGVGLRTASKRGRRSR